MNRTEAADRAEAKIREAKQVARSMRSGVRWTGQHPVQGFGTVPARCPHCGTRNDVPRQQGNYVLGPCATCGIEREQERIW